MTLSEATCIAQGAMSPVTMGGTGYLYTVHQLGEAENTLLRSGYKSLAQRCSDALSLRRRLAREESMRLRAAAQAKRTRLAKLNPVR